MTNTSFTGIMSDWIFSEWFWLKPGLTWDDFKPEEGILKPQPEDLLTWPFVIAAALLFFRNYILLPFVLTPIGKHYGVRSKPYKPPAFNDKLEQLYKVNRARPPRELLTRYALELDWEERKVKRWLLQKTLSTQMTTLDKFNEFGWHFVYYTSIFIFGLFAVVSEPFFWDTEKCIENYPHTGITTGLWWYNIISLAFYMSQTYLLCTQTRSHDFIAKFCHHIVAIMIVSAAWINNFVKTISIGLSIHLCVDIFFGLAKLFFYCGKTEISNMLFIPFTIFWILTRCIMYPFHAMRAFIFGIYRLLGVIWPSYFLICFLSSIIMFLQVYWTTEIIVALKLKFNNKSVVDGTWSPEELSDDEVPQTVKKIKKIS